MNLLYTLFLFFLSILPSFSPTLSFAQDPNSSLPPTTTDFPSSGSNVSSSSASTNSTTSTSTPTTFANLTTTNAQGSTIVTSVPITVGPSTTPSTTSSAPFPSLTGYPTCGTFHSKPAKNNTLTIYIFELTFFLVFFLFLFSPPPRFRLRSNQLSNRCCRASQLLEHHSSCLLLHKPVCQSLSPLAFSYP